MRLHVLQHGEAFAKEENLDRPLTEKGRRDVGRIATFLGASGAHAGAVWHSGKLRAAETASVLAAAVGGEPPEAVAGIGPTDATAEFVQQIAGREADLLIASHMPFVEKLVSRLAAGDEDAGVVAFRPGTVVTLERREGGGWSVVRMLRPEDLPA